MVASSTIRAKELQRERITGSTLLVRNQIFEEIAQAADIALPAYENAFNTLTQSSINPREIKLITTISRGSSSCATEFLSQVLTNNPTRTRALDPALFYDDEKPSFNQDEIVIALSQSGETGEVVNALKYASKFTSNTIAIHNSKNSSLSTAAFWDIFLDAGVEKSVPATKSVVAQLAAILAIHDWFTGTNNKEQITEFTQNLTNALAEADKFKLDPYKVHAVLATKAAIPIAKEVALKMTELWGTPIWGGNALEFLHGPIAITRESNNLIFLGDLTQPSLQPLKEKVDLRGLKLLQAPYKTNKISSLLLSLAIWQQVAANSAINIGVDPANPFGLSKVTQT